MPKKSDKKTKARPRVTSKSKPSEGASATLRSSAAVDIPRATKESDKKTATRTQATSNSKSSQASCEDTRQSKRKRDQDEDQVNYTKKKTARVTRNATAKAAKAVEGETIRQTSNEQELSLADLEEAVPALQKMYARMRAGKRQLGKRRSGERFQLSPALQVAFASRYRAARNRHEHVDYQRLSETDNFKSFKGHAEVLRAKEPELKVLLKKALAEQREIDAGKSKPNIEALEKEFSKLAVQHEEDVAKRKQLEVDMEQREEQHNLTISKLKESHEVEIRKLQSELNEEKAKCNALKEVMMRRDTSAELGGDVNEVKDKVAELEQKLNADTTRQAELVAFGNRLADRELALAEKERGLAKNTQWLAEKEQWLAGQAEDLGVERKRIDYEWAMLEMEKSQHDTQVRADPQDYADCKRALNEATDNANKMRDGWAAE